MNIETQQKVAINKPQADACMLSPYFLHVLLNDMIKYFSSKEQARLSQACYHLYTIFKPILCQSRYKKLLQSVIDDEREVVKKILDVKPELLVEDPEKTLVIESQKTWQRFLAEKPLQMAIKRNQIGMIKLLLPYFEKLHNGQVEALGQWEICDANKQEIECYADMMKAIIDVIAKENFPNGRPTCGDEIGRTSKKTQTVLEVFRKQLIPDRAITLDNYFDVEQLFIISLQAFFFYIHLFQNNDQRKLYIVVVIGFIQSVFTPELAKIFCEGFSYIGMEEECLSENAQSLMLNNFKTPFYRLARGSLSGLGFHHAVGSTGQVMDYLDSSELSSLISYFKKDLAKKQGGLAHLKNKLKEKVDIEEMATLTWITSLRSQ